MTLKIRLSPSGPEIGDPAAQVGNSAVAGRVWGKSGVGSNVVVPGSAAGDIPGLESVPVDMKPTSSGYQYDLEADSNTFGTGGLYRIAVYGSTDSGATFPVLLMSINPGGIGGGDYLLSGAARLHHWGFESGANTINRVKMQIQRPTGQDNALTYAPADSTIRITEISPTS